MNPLQPPVGFRLHWFAQGAVKTCRVCCHCQAFWHAEIAALKLTTSGLTWNLAVISQHESWMVPTFVADPTRRFLKSWGIPKSPWVSVPPLKMAPFWMIYPDDFGQLHLPETLAIEKKQWISGKFQRRYTPGLSGQTSWIHLLLCRRLPDLTREMAFINWAYGTPMN